jgi:hypothetical protein
MEALQEIDRLKGFHDLSKRERELVAARRLELRTYGL